MINDVRAIAISFPHTGLAASLESEAWRVCNDRSGRRSAFKGAITKTNHMAINMGYYHHEHPV